MELQCLDHVHLSVPDLQRAKRLYGPFLSGDFERDGAGAPAGRPAGTPAGDAAAPSGGGRPHFVDDYGGPEVNAYGAWHTSGGDFIQVIDPSRPAFGGGTIPRHGLLSVSFRVADVDRGIAEAKAHGLTVRSRVGSEDIGLGKNVVQAQLLPEPVSGLPLELIEHQLPGEYVPLTAVVEFVELVLARGVALDAASAALERILGSAFESERLDRARGLRTRRHAGLGLQLAVPLAGSEAAEASLRTIAMRCRDLEAGLAAATAEGLVVARRVGAPGADEIDFEPWAGASLRLVGRSGA